MDNLRVVAAACQFNGLTYSVPAPGRHHDILLRMPAPERHLCEQGFLLSNGRFVGRVAARYVALDQKQILDPSKLHGTDLFSEDLW